MVTRIKLMEIFPICYAFFFFFSRSCTRCTPRFYSVTVGYVCIWLMYTKYFVSNICYNCVSPDMIVINHKIHAPQVLLSLFTLYCLPHNYIDYAK